MFEDLTFDLPDELIAQAPAHPRDHARLLVYSRKDKTITDTYFYNLEQFLPKETTLVLNNSKVEKCRLKFPPINVQGTSLYSKGVEVFVLETANPTTIKAMVRPGKKFKAGSSIEVGGITFTVDSIDEDGLRIIRLSHAIDDPIFDPYRLTPLPPYIAQDESLASEYQNVYADPLGSKASPTAGLHFTDELLAKIVEHHDIAKLTLHVGLGTFAPLKQENIESGRLHAERYDISEACANTLNKAVTITAVGTTSVRTLESAASMQQPMFRPVNDSTDIFIRPGYKFKAVDHMITNFHLPSTSLLMLVAAFIADVQEVEEAKKELLRIYDHAITNKYRFYSFGDAMLIL